jgi:hypothetical protein
MLSPKLRMNTCEKHAKRKFIPNSLLWEIHRFFLIHPAMGISIRNLIWFTQLSSKAGAPARLLLVRWGGKKDAPNFGRNFTALWEML